MNVNINWDAVTGIGTLLAVIVALFLGLIAVFGRRQEIKKNANVLRFQLVTELLYLKAFLESSERKQPKPPTGNIDFGPVVDKKYHDILSKLQLYFGQSVLLSYPEIEKFETVIYFIQLIVNKGNLSKKHRDRRRITLTQSYCERPNRCGRLNNHFGRGNSTLC